MHFQLHHLIQNVSPKFQTFQKIYNVWQLFSRNCFEELGGLKWCRAAVHIVGTASIRAPASDRWEKWDSFGRRKWPYWRTTAAKLGPAGMRLPFFDLQFLRRAAPQGQPACTLTATYVAHFFPSWFWTAPVRCGKLSVKPVKPPVTKNRPAAVGFATQALTVELQPYGGKNLDGYRRAAVPPIHKTENLPTKMCRWLWSSVSCIARISSHSTAD
jgi:hypothetical protein